MSRQASPRHIYPVGVLSAHLAREQALEFLRRQAQAEVALYSHRYAPRLLRHHHGYGVAALRYAQRGAVAQPQVLGNVVAVRHGQYASGGADAFFRYDHGSVVQRRVLEEDVLYESLVDVGVYQVARLHDVVEPHRALYDYERAHLAPRHVDARHHYGHDGLLVSPGLLRAVAREEEPRHHLEAAVCAERVEKLAYLFLEKHDESYHTDAHQLVHNRPEETHLYNLANEKPYYHEDDDAYEDIERTALLHEAVNIIEHHRHKDDVHHILYSEIYHCCRFFQLYFITCPHCLSEVRGAVRTHGSHYPHSLHTFPHIVHAQYGRALEQGDGVERGGAVERAGGIRMEQSRYHALARYAHEQRQLKLVQALQRAHYAVVLLKRLAEAEARVEYHVLHAKVAQLLHLLRESLHHAVQVGLYRHQYVSHTEARHSLKHAFLLMYRRVDNARYATLRHVVYDVGTELLHAHPRHRGTVGVDRQYGVGLFAAHYGERAPQPFGLLAAAHLSRPGTCGERAHINYLSSLLHYLVSPVGYLRLRLPPASLKERVGRGIEDAHHLRFGQVEESSSRVYCVCKSFHNFCFF